MFISILSIAAFSIIVNALSPDEPSLMHVEKRVPSYGAVALAAATCPGNLGTCPVGLGKCCPDSLSYCYVLGVNGLVMGTACCPTGTPPGFDIWRQIRA